MQKTREKPLGAARTGVSPSTLLDIHAHETLAPNTKPQLNWSSPLSSKSSGRIRLPAGAQGTRGWAVHELHVTTPLKESSLLAPFNYIEFNFLRHLFQTRLSLDAFQRPFKGSGGSKTSTQTGRNLEQDQQVLRWSLNSRLCGKHYQQLHKCCYCSPEITTPSDRISMISSRI